MDAPRILCVAGSPRRHGNSEQLLDAAVGGIEAVGGVADRLVVVDAGIAPCRGCNACTKTGVCRVDDGMQAVFPRIDQADAIIVASPVFFATVPAVLKALYDRCQPYWARTHRLGYARPPRRPGGLLLARGGGDPFGFDAAVTTTRSVFAVLQLDLLAQVYVEGVDTPNDVQKHPVSLGEARDLGAAMVAAANATPHS